MATADEDFSFPATTTDSPPRFLDSPPLWRRSAATSCRERSKGKEVEGGERIFNLPSFQEFRSSSAKERNCSKSNYEDGVEEKMDMLWEDLNEDQFARNGGKSAENSDISSPRRDLQISCVRALKLSKASNGHMISGKKTSILVFIKALKKVFLVHNSQRAIKKKPTW